MRGSAALFLLAGCAESPIKMPCDFTVQVHVTEKAEAECRALVGNRKWLNDEGMIIRAGDTIHGCAPEGRIITNGTPENMGHEMKHLVEANCRK